MKLTKFSRTIIIALGMGTGKLLSDGILILENDNKNYLIYISRILKKSGINTTLVLDKEERQKDAYFEQTIKSFAFRTYKHKFMKVYRCMLYDNMKRKWLNRFYPLHWAILFMECGKLLENKNSFNLILNTYLTLEQNQVIIHYLQEQYNIDFFSIKANIDNKYNLCCNNFKNIKKFITMIEPYICPSMQYKITFSGQTISFGS